MTHSKPLLRKDIQYAQSNTKSHAQAARYLNVAFSTYKKYAKAYGIYDTEHKNKAGRGLTKAKKKGVFGLSDILEGKYPNYDRFKLKERLVRGGYLKHRCRYCGNDKTRVDGKGPFKLDYIDGNPDNLNLENLELICYNCTFLTTGRMTVDMQTDVVEHRPEDLQLSSEDLEELRKELHGHRSS